MAEVEGFEPSYPVKDHAFQACAIDHYATPPFSLVLNFNITRQLLCQATSTLGGEPLSIAFHLSCSACEDCVSIHRYVSYPLLCRLYSALG